MAPAMRHLGSSGLVVSVVGLGCNNLGRPGTPTAEPAGADAVVNAAIDAGITFFDTADTYGSEPGLSERLLGVALGKRRDEVTIGTKVGMDVKGANGPDFGARGSRRYIVQSCEASLRRLGTDHLDLYQLHTPDPTTPIEETLAALDTLVRSGKVRYIGHSNRAGWQIAQAEYVAREIGSTRFVSSQSHYNLLDRRAELEVVPAALALGLGVLPYFPLANGLLTGKYRRDSPAPTGSRLSMVRQRMLAEAPWDQLDRIETVANDHGITMLQLALSWLAAQSAVGSVIAGATRPEQVISNAEAVTALDEPTLAAIDAIFPPPRKVALF